MHFIKLGAPSLKSDSDVLRKMMKRIVTIGILSACLAGCANQHFATKPWHTSPSRNPEMSVVYPHVEWPVVQKLTPGMSSVEAKALVHDLQSYHHPVNAIIFTEFKERRYEVALKLSKDKLIIEDISYKRRD